MHQVTKSMKDQVESMLEKKGVSPTPDQQSMLDQKYDEVDHWMDHKPDWVPDDAVEAKVKDVKTGSMVD